MALGGVQVLSHLVSRPWLKSAGRAKPLLAACVALGLAGQADAIQVRQAPQGAGSAVVPLTSQALPPLAHVRFCMAYPGECAPNRNRRALRRSEQDLLSELVLVNLSVNREITPKADNDAAFGGDDWQLYAQQGDCEDYALMKRKLLIDRGWDSSQLRIATALTPEGIGHAVLVARIGHRDVVLDNLSLSVRPWQETGYRFLKIQSDRDPTAWFNVAETVIGGRRLS